LQSVRDCCSKTSFPSIFTALAAASLSRDPFADVGRTVSECDAIRFAEGQEFHRITVNQLDFREFDGDDTDFLERGPKDFQVFPCNPPTDAESNTLLNPKSVDSARHGRASLLPAATLANRTPAAPQWKMQQMPKIEWLANW
jgi:hypothetical protein